MLEVVRAIRRTVGRDFHLQVKISVTEHNDAFSKTEGAGNTIRESRQVCQMLEAEGVDAIHASTGSFFPHPRNPAGEFPVEELVKTYDTLISSGMLTLRNFLFLRGRVTGKIFRRRWDRARGDFDKIQGLNLPDARKIKQSVGIPVLCTGGFQDAPVIRQALERGSCDAVSIARPLIANNDLVKMFAQGIDSPPVPCTYCNKCLVNAPENPLGCYDETRFSSREEMVREIMSVFDPPPFR